MINNNKNIVWDRFWRNFYGRYRKHRITYMMHQVANAVAMARRAEMRKPPRFALYRRTEREVIW